jgi:hypothetical protein
MHFLNRRFLDNRRWLGLWREAIRASTVSLELARLRGGLL